MADQSGLDDQRMKLRYAGSCRLCGTMLPARTDAVYERATKTVRCVECAPAGVEHAPVVTSHAGASARREYERRKSRDEERLRQKWGRLGGVAVALSDERQSTTAWATAAVGEERLGAHLDGLASPSLAVLHDRRIPRSRANIDHLVITPSGIWVVDAKRYKGRPRLEIEGGILRPRVDKLIVGRRNKTKLVDDMLKQIDVVRGIVGGLPVTGALCFVGPDKPRIGGSFTTRGVHVLSPKKLSTLLTQPAEPCLDVAEVRRILETSLPPA